MEMEVHLALADVKRKARGFTLTVKSESKAGAY